MMTVVVSSLTQYMRLGLTLPVKIAFLNVCVDVKNKSSKPLMTQVFAGKGQGILKAF